MSAILAKLSRETLDPKGAFITDSFDKLGVVSKWVNLPMLRDLSWKGLVAISCPEPATPMMIDSPQPLWQASSATRITFTLPMHSKV